MEALFGLCRKAVENEAQEYWLSKAKKIVEPTREAIIHNAALYPALKKLMIEEKAHGHLKEVPKARRAREAESKDLAFLPAPALLHCTDNLRLPPALKRRSWLLFCSPQC